MSETKIEKQIKVIERLTTKLVEDHEVWRKALELIAEHGALSQVFVSRTAREIARAALEGRLVIESEAPTTDAEGDS